MGAVGPLSVLLWPLRSEVGFAGKMSEIRIQISDRLDSSLTQRILARRDKAKPGPIWKNADFLDPGGREPVDKALQRRVASGVSEGLIGAV
jgi:hypothetical protein